MKYEIVRKLECKYIARIKGRYSIYTVDSRGRVKSIKRHISEEISDLSYRDMMTLIEEERLKIKGLYMEGVLKEDRSFIKKVKEALKCLKMIFLE